MDLETALAQIEQYKIDKYELKKKKSDQMKIYYKNEENRIKHCLLTNKHYYKYREEKKELKKNLSDEEKEKIKIKKNEYYKTYYKKKLLKKQIEEQEKEKLNST